MKSFLRKMCCFFLIASLLLQTAPGMAGQPGQNLAGKAAVRANLEEARRILSEGSGAKGAQSAVRPLEQAKGWAADPSFTKSYPGKVSAFQGDIEKARLKVLWNDQSEALAIVCRLLGQLDCPTPVPQNPCGDGPGAGLAIGATLIAGIGAVFLGLFFGLGQVSHR